MEHKKNTSKRKTPKYSPHPKEPAEPPVTGTGPIQVDPMPPRPKPSVRKSE